MRRLTGPSLSIFKESPCILVTAITPLESDSCTKFACQCHSFGLSLDPALPLILNLLTHPCRHSQFFLQCLCVCLHVVPTDFFGEIALLNSVPRQVYITILCSTQTSSRLPPPMCIFICLCMRRYVQVDVHVYVYVYVNLYVCVCDVAHVCPFVEEKEKPLLEVSYQNCSCNSKSGTNRTYACDDARRRRSKQSGRRRYSCFAATPSSASAVGVGVPS